jgi:hypothetical protein
MKILKTEDIKTAIIAWLKTVYTDGYKVDSHGYHYTVIRLKDVGSVEINFLRRRNIRVTGSTNSLQVGGGVSFGRRDGSMLIHGGAKSDFGIFDEVELKRRIDVRFAKQIEDAKLRKKSEQEFTDKCSVLNPILTSWGFVTNNQFTWQKIWEYDKKLRVTLCNGRSGNLKLDFLNGDNNHSDEEILKWAKGFKEILSGELRILSRCEERNFVG